jgi:hypothetical protein
MPTRFGGREVRPFPGGLGTTFTDKISITVDMGSPVADEMLNGGIPESFMWLIRLRTPRVMGFKLMPPKRRLPTVPALPLAPALRPPGHMKTRIRESAEIPRYSGRLRSRPANR